MSEHDETFELDPAGAPGAPEPLLASMLAAYREEEDMPSDAKARVQRRLESAPAVGVGEAAGGSSRGLWIGLAVAAVVAAIVVAPRLGKDESEADGSAAEYQGSQLPPEQRASAPVVERDSSPTPGDAEAPAPVEETAPRFVDTPPVEVEDGDGAPQTTSAPDDASVTNRRKRGPKTKAVAPTEPLSPADSLAEETALLRKAQSALSGGEPRRALSVLREHEQRFADGVLAEERRALKVVALCDDGQVERGRSQARAFLAKHPGSALRERVAAACPPTQGSK